MATAESVKKPNVLKERWDSLEPARKKQVALLGMVLVVVCGAYMVVSGSGGSTAPKSTTAQGKIENALMPTEGARDLGVNAANRQLRDIRSEVRQLSNENERLKTKLEREQMQGGQGSSEQRLIEEIGTLRQELGVVRQQQAQAAAAAMNAQRQPGVQQGVGGSQVVDPNAPAPPAAFGGIRAVNQQQNSSPAAAPPQAGTVAPSSTPASMGGEGAQVPSQVSSGERMYLPAGSILSGVLLSGVDAPSGKAAMKDPVPVLARIKNDAILPNRFRADVKECFMLLETVGDMASERAMMRAITMTCARRDRSIVEVPMSGYAVGEDGRAGLRGMLVTKQGAVLGKAALAGFTDGLARAFGQGNQLTIGGGGAGISSDTLSSGAIGGASSALDRISQWYLERADELNPTISIDSGRKVTIVLTKGRELVTLGTASSAEPTSSPAVLQASR